MDGLVAFLKQGALRQVVLLLQRHGGGRRMDAWFSRHCIAAHSRNNSRVLSAWTPLETSTLNGGFFDAVQKYATRAGLVCGERSTDRVQQVGVLAKFTRLLIIRRGGAVRIQWPGPVV